MLCFLALTVSRHPSPEKGAYFLYKGWKAHSFSETLQVSLFPETCLSSTAIWVKQINLTCPCFPWDFGLSAQTVLLTVKERICWAEFINYGPNIDVPILHFTYSRTSKNRAETFIILVLLYWVCQNKSGFNCKSIMSVCLEQPWCVYFSLNVI